VAYLRLSATRVDKVSSFHLQYRLIAGGTDLRQLTYKPLVSCHGRIFAALHHIGLAAGTAYRCCKFDKLLRALHHVLAFQIFKLAEKMPFRLRRPIPGTVAVKAAAGGLKRSQQDIDLCSD